MDENYLDSLLNGAINDSQKNNDFDKSVDLDSGIDLDLNDLADISLEELDDLDGLDLGDLELDDIDFDDLDITNLAVDNSDNDNSVKEDFNLDSILADDVQESMGKDSYIDPEEEAIVNSFSQKDDVFSDADDELFNDLGMAGGAVSSNNSEMGGIPDEVFSNAQAADYQTIDGLFGKDNGSANSHDNAELADMLDSAFELDQILAAGDSASNTSDKMHGDNSSSGQEADLDDMLMNAAIDFDNPDLAGIEDVEAPKGKKKKKKKDGEKVKKSFSEILFGTPDEDDIEEEKQNIIKKEQKLVLKEQKKTEKQQKKAEKQEKLAIKKENDRKAKEAKDAKRKAELEVYLEEEKNQKQVPTPVVIIVFVIFALVGGASFFGSKSFHYTEVIRKAADYFERQRYRLAYDEVSGVEVKDKDEELKDRIYTVMYVERLYESYDNNMKLGRFDKALDALLRGLEKYDEHYAEAVELNIVKDIDSCKVKIVDALGSTYHITEKQAKEILTLEGQEYLQALNKCCEDIETETGE